MAMVMSMLTKRKDLASDVAILIIMLRLLHSVAISNQDLEHLDTFGFVRLHAGGSVPVGDMES